MCEWNPDTYLDEMHAEIPGYEELQDAVAGAVTVASDGGRRILELGTGTGETALRILARLPQAEWTGIDADEGMLGRARERLPHADLRLGRLEGPLPEGHFDVVVSVLAVHHLDGNAKRDLFTRVSRLSDVFVMGDVVVPEDPSDAVIEIDGVYDVPSSVADQEQWLREAGFTDVETTNVRADLALFVARRRPRR